jgi:uncharacterized protein
VTASYTVKRGIMMPVRDGVRLATDLWLPDTAGPVPAILFRTPYDRVGYNTEVLRPQQCVEAGFVAVVQDMRGRFASEGDWRPMNWGQEAEDSYDAIEWIAAQPWCSGAVGMSGLSYCGTVQLVTSLLRPPHLKAIAPAMASSPEFDRIEAGGAFRLDLATSWLAFTALDWLTKRVAAGQPVPGGAEFITRAVLDPRILYHGSSLREIPLFALEGFPTSFDRMYAVLNQPTDPNGIALEIPCMHIGGWYDFSHATAVELFRRQRAAGNRESYLVMGGWGHSAQLPHCQGQINLGALGSGAVSRLPDLVLRFFRRQLCGESIGLPRARYFVFNKCAWLEDDQWPPRASRPVRLYMGGDSTGGTLGKATGAAGTISFASDAKDPVPTVGGRTLNLGRLVSGPIDQAPLYRRDDVLLYTGEAVTEPLDIAGAVSAHLWISIDTRDADLVVKLVDVDPSGVSLPICEGALRLRFRKGFEQESPIEPGSVEQVTIPLGHAAWRVLPDHRLGLQVQGTNFPHLDINDVAGPHVRTSIHHGAGRSSHVEFGVAT